MIYREKYWSFFRTLTQQFFPSESDSDWLAKMELALSEHININLCRMCAPIFLTRYFLVLSSTVVQLLAYYLELLPLQYVFR